MFKTSRSWAPLLWLLALGCDPGAPSDRGAPASGAPTATTTSTISVAGPSPAATSTASAMHSADPTSSAVAPPSADQDREAIRTAFLDYRKAIGARNGEQAATLASSRTIGYFERTRKAALVMGEPELRKQPFMDRFMTLTMRARIDPDMMRKMDGRALFAHAVNEGMVGENTKTLEPASVEIQGDTAQLSIRAGKQTLAPKDGFRFDREDGAWKLDVMSITPIAEPALKKGFAAIDPDLDVAIVKLLEGRLGKPLAPAIWKAPGA